MSFNWGYLSEAQDQLLGQVGAHQHPKEASPPAKHPNIFPASNTTLCKQATPQPARDSLGTPALG